MATPERNTATPDDETLLDAIAADHVSHMSRCAQQASSHGDAKDRRKPAAPPSPPEPREESPDAGAFRGDSQTPKKTPAPIIVDLPIEVSAVNVAPARADTEDSTYQPTTEPEKNLAEEILSQQMTDEMKTAAPATFASEFAEEEIPQAAPADDPIEMMAEQVASAAPAPVRPRPIISAIRPPTQPSRVRSLVIQGLIVLLSLTAVALVAYLMELLKR